jgi:hypothetical protein
MPSVSVPSPTSVWETVRHGEAGFRRSHDQAVQGPAGGWGSVRSLAEILPREHVSPEVLRELTRQNKVDGFMPA